MNDPRIIYTSIMYKQVILLEHFDEYNETISHIKERILPSTIKEGVKIINENSMDHLYSRDSDQVCLFVTIDSDFNKETASNYLNEIKKHLFNHYGLVEIKKMDKNFLKNDMGQYIVAKCREYNEKWMDKSKVALLRTKETQEKVI